MSGDFSDDTGDSSSGGDFSSPAGGSSGGDSFTEVTSESWLSRLGNAVKGVIVGIVLFLVSFPLLWWNEGRAVHTAEGLSELGRVVVTVPADKVDPANDKKPVHITAEAVTDEVLADPQFPVSAKAIKLRRKVEAYQWKETTSSETRNKVGGGTETKKTYSYDKGWFDHAIDSSGFHNREGHANPAAMRFPAAEQSAKVVNLGKFKLSSGLIALMNDYKPVPFTAADLEKLSPELKSEAKLAGDLLYLPPTPNGLPPDPASPNVGDVRIAFDAVGPGTVSIIARQLSDSFEPWQSRAGTTVQELMAGAVSAENMIRTMEQTNSMLTWLLRLAGFVLMAIGIALVFNPLVVFADVLPLLGDILGMGVGIFAVVIAASLSLLTIAVAWLAYRPVMAVALIVAAVAIVLGVRHLCKGKKKTSRSGFPA